MTSVFSAWYSSSVIAPRSRSAASRSSISTRPLSGAGAALVSGVAAIAAPVCRWLAMGAVFWARACGSLVAEVAQRLAVLDSGEFEGGLASEHRDAEREQDGEQEDPHDIPECLCRTDEHEQEQRAANRAVGHRGTVAQGRRQSLAHLGGRAGRAGEPGRRDDHDPVGDHRDRDREEQRRADVPHLMRRRLVRRDLDEAVDDRVAGDSADQQQRRSDQRRSTSRSFATSAGAGRARGTPPARTAESRAPAARSRGP